HDEIVNVYNFAICVIQMLLETRSQSSFLQECNMQFTSLRIEVCFREQSLIMSVSEALEALPHRF
ncbi:hypothetical protein ACQP3L_37940, partial [Escherichia coli]